MDYNDILNGDITPPVAQPPSERPEKPKSNISFWILVVCVVLMMGIMFYQGSVITSKQNEIKILQTNTTQCEEIKTLASMCNDGFVKCAAVVSQCKTYLSTLSNTSQFNFNGETNISRMKELPFGPETVYIKVLDDVLFDR